MKREILKDFIYHLFIISAPAYIALSYRITEIMSFNISILKTLKILGWSTQHKTKIVLFIAFIIPLILTYLKRWNIERNKIKKDSFHKEMYDVSGKIFIVLNDVLSIKRKAVLDYLDSSNNKPEVSLKDVIKPTEQIFKIFEGIIYIFKKISNTDHVKVSIIECKDQKLYRYLYQSDDEARTQIDELNEKRTTARQCIVKKQLIIYEKTNGLIRRHWFYGDKSRIKSIMCYPVMSGKNILYVISLSSKEESTFKESERKKYELIFEQFSYRIMLESYLSRLISNN